MSQMRIFKTIDNGEIAIQLYNPDTDLEGSLRAFREGFIAHDNISIASGLNLPEAVRGHRDFEKFVQANLSDGLSLVARHLPTGQIVGFSFNKFHTRPVPGAPSLAKESPENNSHAPEFDPIISFSDFAYGRIDLYSKFNTDCFFECGFLATLAEFRGRKIGFHLVECTLGLAREITAGKYPETMDKSFIGRKPKIVFAIWASMYAARIGDSLGFRALEKIPFSDLKFHGVPYPERIPPDQTHCVLAAIEI